MRKHFVELVLAIFVSSNAFNSHRTHRTKSSLSITKKLKARSNESEIEIKIAMAKHTLLSVAASIMCVPSEILTTPPMLDPDPPSSPRKILLRKTISDILASGWSPKDGFEIPPEDIQLVDYNSKEESVHLPSTYGEITELGARQLFHYMGLTSSDIQANTESVFMDLGCGNGKLIVQAYMELPVIRRIIGVELANARYNIAMQAWEKLRGQARDIRLSAGAADAVLDIYQGDLFQLDVSTATHIYVASLCFTDNMMVRLAEKMEDEADKLRCLATLKPFPQEFEKCLGGKPKRRFVEMTWTKPRGHGCIVYIYSR